MTAPSAANIRKKLRAGKKLGATELASARARGMVKRADGTKRKSKKYAGKAAGGSLKPVPTGTNGKGLRKLPTAVRNKMGFMKKGGLVKK